MTSKTEKGTIHIQWFFDQMLKKGGNIRAENTVKLINEGKNYQFSEYTAEVIKNKHGIGKDGILLHWRN